MVAMEPTGDKRLSDFVSSGADQPITAKHRAWMNAKIKGTLEKKKCGEMNYIPLDQIRREFELDAS
jgi:hypothetical protein